MGCVASSFASSASAGGQSEQPSEVNNSTSTGTRCGAAEEVAAWPESCGTTKFKAAGYKQSSTRATGGKGDGGRHTNLLIDHCFRRLQIFPSIWCETDRGRNQAVTLVPSRKEFFRRAKTFLGSMGLDTTSGRRSVTEAQEETMRRTLPILSPGYLVRLGAALRPADRPHDATHNHPAERRLGERPPPGSARPHRQWRAVWPVDRGRDQES